MENVGYVNTVIGTLKITSDQDGISEIKYLDKNAMPDSKLEELSPVLRQCICELKKYFEEGFSNFTVRLKIKGTPFQEKVWEELLKIPYGKTVSYGEISKAIGNPKASRAVGHAVGQNNLNIVIPCHRV